MDLNLIKIEEETILCFYKEASRKLKNNSYRINNRNSQFSIFTYMLSINTEDDIQSEIENYILRLLRRGISIFYSVFAQYEKSSGLDILKQSNLNTNLSSRNRVEISEKESTATLVGLFAFSSYMTFLLNNYEKETDNLKIELIKDNFLEISNKENGINSVLFEIYSNIQLSNTDKELVKVMKDYFHDLNEKLIILSKSSNFTEFFTKYSYKIENDDFLINGFELPKKSFNQILTMQFKKPEEVIGNHIAKSQAMRLSKMILAYDFKTQKNPFVELGGFNFTFMGDGLPGTGKTTLIQMMAGLINDYCSIAEVPFRYENFSVDEIDMYQGKSGQNIKSMINRILDPQVIGFGTIDDIDQIAGKRGDKNSSTGQQEVTAVLMESFSGANTIIRGNATFGMFSNFPENVDDALRQRASLRMLIDGPKTQEDYIDIFKLLIGENHNIPLGNHNYFKNQEIKKMVQNSYREYNVPKENIILSVYEKTKKELGELNDLTKIGIYLKKIQEEDSRFTGRAIKNITDSIKSRAMDFDMPDEWFEDPKIFLRKNYEVKKMMIRDLMKPITVEMALQEINIYADSEARYIDNSDRTEVEKIIRDYKIQEEARKKLNS